MNDNIEQFTFEISLSVLNHLGRNLYRNFITVLGEAISNSWDADANNVWIFIDRENDNFVIKDDGNGMNADDFQNKFLAIGYSKRKNGDMRSRKNRPFIGAKGIGKLALLSCAKKVSIITKTADTNYISGTIDNTGLDEAIKQQLKPDQYPLGDVEMSLFEPYIQDHTKGTIIHFEQTKEDIRNTISHLKKLVALYFRFSLIDEGFNIFINDEKVILTDIKNLSDATEFLWNINVISDPYIETLTSLGSEAVQITSGINIKGFIATVKKPRDIKIPGTEEKMGVDMFVNGRLRENNILKHIPTARVAESYMYGQIHFDELDSDGVDRFNTSRDAVVASDEKYRALLGELKSSIIPRILDEWDNLRLSRDEEGDDESPRKTKKERRALSLYNLSSEDYSNTGGSDGNNVKGWIKGLKPDAEFNIPAYVDCFLSENLVRKLIDKKGLSVQSQETEYNKWKKIETQAKVVGNLNIDIRRNNNNSFYLGMEPLVRVLESPTDGRSNNLLTDEKQYTPIRNAVMHTALLTDEAKRKLTTIYDNIKARINALLS